VVKSLFSADLYYPAQLTPLQPQTGHTVFWCWSDETSVSPVLKAAFEFALQSIDSLIELDFQKLADPSSPLAQLYVKAADLSDQSVDGGESVLGLHELSNSFLNVAGDVSYEIKRSNTISFDVAAVQNPFVLSGFSNNLYEALVHVSLHEICHALGLIHPWEGTAGGEVSDFTISQTVMAYAFGTQLFSRATLTELDVKALLHLHKEETALAALPLNTSLSHLSLGDLTINANSLTATSQISIPVRRYGNSELDVQVLIKAQSWSGDSRLSSSLLPLQIVSLPSGVIESNVTFTVPTGALHSLQLVLTDPRQALLSEVSASQVVDVHALELTLTPSQLIGTSVLLDQGSELILLALDPGLAQTWRDVLPRILQSIDQIIDLDFAWVEPSHPNAQVFFSPSLNGAFSKSRQTPAFTLGNLSFSSSSRVQLLLPDSNVNAQVQFLQQFLQLLGMESPLDDGDGDSYTKTAVFPADSLLYTQLPAAFSWNTVPELTTLDSKALTILHGPENDMLAGGDPRFDAVIDPSLSELTFSLLALPSGFNSETVKARLVVQRNGILQLKSQAVVYFSSWSTVSGSAPFEPLLLSFEPGVVHQQFEFSWIKGSVQALEFSMLPLYGISTSETIALKLAANDVKALENAAFTPAYKLFLSASFYNEGSSLSTLVEVTNVPSGTSFYWSISGSEITADDFSSGALMGTAQVDEYGMFSFSHVLANDSFTEGDEAFQIKLFSDPSLTIQVGSTAFLSILDTSTTPLPTFSLVPSSTSVNEGASIVYTLSTTNIGAGTNLFYQFSGRDINVFDFISSTISGSVVVGGNGQLTISRTLTADKFTEGTETLTLMIFTDAAAQTPLVSNSVVMVNDTSLTPVTPSHSVFTQKLEIPYKPGSIANVPLLYTTSSGDANLSGLTLNVHYNSSVFIPSGANNGVSVQVPSAIVTTTLLPDTMNLDGDLLTDKVLQLLWSTTENLLLNQTLPVPLATVSFDTLSTSRDTLTGQPLSTAVRYTSSHNPTGYDFLTGSTLFKAQEFFLDVDGDGKVTALGDGLMVIRYLFGPSFSGPALTDKAISSTSPLLSGATYNALSAVQKNHVSALVASNIQQGIDSGLLDVDKDGRTTALGDGLMVIRRLFGSSFSGTALIDKAISPSSSYLGGLTYATMSTDQKLAAFDSVSTNIDALKLILY